MEWDTAACDRASQSRDPRFDGRFFIGVVTTGIYCRPVCPAPCPKRQNVRYFASAAAAATAGFRPCLRCRPEASPGTPAWQGTSALVSRGLRMIDDGVLDDGKRLDDFAARLGVTSRHARRLFLRYLGATPVQVAATRRLHFAKKLIDETDLPFSDVAFAAGFGSIRCFNREIHRTYGRTPTQLRGPARAAHRTAVHRLRLSYRPPYDWDALLAFLRERAIPGVEAVDRACYRRSIEIDGVAGGIDVGHARTGAALELSVRFPNPHALLQIVTRVRHLFDLGADPGVIGAHLGDDPMLRRILRRHPGVRLPGAWDGFELTVRAILGQGQSQSLAATLAGCVAAAFGREVEPGQRLFPPPAALREANLERAGVDGERAGVIRRVAATAAAGGLSFGPAADVGATIERLGALPGVTAATVAEVAMRACGQPDAFPAEDAVLRAACGASGAAELERRAEPWRPWRAYAAMLLWRDDAEHWSPSMASAR
jgi:AraC family transcriptional regulator of adaptative response / DNA-3-methyladenine glycosylase II